MRKQALPKVLVVDDDPVVGKSFDRVLSRKGYAVVTARNGEEALRKIADEDYDAVFTDIKMPGIDGIQVAEQIRSQRPWLPVVIVSGYATVENEARAKAAGVCAVLHKPLSPQMIEQGALDAMRVRSTECADATGEGPAAVIPPPVTPPTPAPVAAGSRAARLAVPALAAPFLTLAFVALAPVLGLLALVAIPAWHFAKWLAARPATEFTRWGRGLAQCMAAPFIGLAYIVALPFIGLGALAWFGCRAAFAARISS